ncbi:MAG: hypothetical protein ACE15E_14315 [Acidobacteriota bacterium]
MASETYGKLLEAAKKLGINNNNRVTWEKMQGSVYSFNKATTNGDKRKAADKLLRIIEEDCRQPEGLSSFRRADHDD